MLTKERIEEILNISPLEVGDYYVNVNLYYFSDNGALQFMKKKIKVEGITELSSYGFIFENLEIESYIEFIKKIFKNLEVIDSQNYNGGHPDFILKNNSTGEKIYLEFKYKNDGIRYGQLDWHLQNLDKDLIYFFADPLIKQYNPTEPIFRGQTRIPKSVL